MSNILNTASLYSSLAEICLNGGKCYLYPDGLCTEYERCDESPVCVLFDSAELYEHREELASSAEEAADMADNIIINNNLITLAQELLADIA